MKRILILSLCLVAFFQACKKDPHHIISGGETVLKELTVASSASVREIAIRTEEKWRIDCQAAWITPAPKSGEGDANVRLSIAANDGFCRKAVIFIEKEQSFLAPDTLVVKQYGNAMYVDVKDNAARSYEISPSGRSISVKLASNLSSSELAKRLSVNCSDDWLSAEVNSVGMTLSISAGSNDSDAARSADVTLAVTDDWGTANRLVISVSQDFVGSASTLTVRELKKKISSHLGTLSFTEDIYVEGIIASNVKGGNVCQNPASSTDGVNLNVSRSSFVIVSEDGSDGICVQMTSSTENILPQKSRARLWLKGATLEKKINPELYFLTDISAKNIVDYTENAVTEVPGKTKSISELNSSDYFTYVTLTDCEIPVREGSYTPVNEGYGSAYMSTKVDEWPTLVRDIRGNQIYLMTNFDCPWRRNGSLRPKGSGSVSGIIVNEKYYRYDSSGNIGDYQIRPQTLEDIAVDRSASASFSRIIAEWKAFSPIMRVEEGSGSITYSGGAVYSASDYSYLGPITGDVNVDAKGVVSGGAWSAGGWGTENFRYWLIEVSTKDLSSSSLSVQIAAQDVVGGPRYWAVEHSTDKSSWTRVAEYTVPDIADWSNTLATQSIGFKEMSFNLPVSLMGRERIYVRLIPTRNSAGGAKAYDGQSISEKSMLSYVSVRCNK